MNKSNEIELMLIDKQIDILCVSEHWITSENIDYICLDNFKVISSFSRSNHIHGGSLIFVGNNINATRVGIFNDFSVECEIEMCGFSFCLPNNFKTVVFSVYRPPSGDINVFFRNLTSVLTSIRNKFDYVVVCGDLNVNLLDNSLSTKILCDIFDSFNLNITSREPTRVFTNNKNQTSSTCLDYIATNIPPEIYKVMIFDPMLSDHYAHLFSLNVRYHQDITITDNKKVYKRDKREHNIQEFNDRLANINWNIIFDLNLNDALIFFLENITWCFDVACPLRLVKERPICKNDTGWLTKILIDEGKEIRKIYYEMKKSNHCPNITSFYKESKNIHRKNIKDAKLKYYNKKIMNAENKSKETWILVNKKLGKAKAAPEHISLNIQNNLISEGNRVANSFALHFSTIAPNQISENFGYNLSLPCTLPEYRINSIYFYPVTESELINAIKALKNKKSSGLDGLTAQIIKSISDNIISPLLYLINLSFSNGEFPDIFKIALVIPVHKKGCKSDIDNYRQISVLSSLSKIIEKILYDRVMSFVLKYKLLSECQHGFRPTKSTETAISHFLKHIYTELDQGRYVVSLFFDLSKAFDSVNKNILSQKLMNIGIRGCLLSCINSYMENRKLVVNCNDCRSDLHDVTLGVPQGSILGPLLFLIYINDLPNHIQYGVTTMYADDTTVSVSAATQEELNIKIYTTLDDVHAWCQRNKLILNNDKTVFVHFNYRRALTSDNLSFSLTTKFLGTFIDSTLTWETHIEYVCKLLNKAYFAILQLKDTIAETGLLSVYYALAYSHLSLNILAWGRSTHLQRVFVSQKRLLRLIFNLKNRESCRGTYINKGIFTVPSVYIYKCLIFAKNNLHSFPTAADNHIHNTRNKELLSIPAHKAANFKKSLHYNCVVLFNTLPKTVKDMNLASFKKEIKNLLLRHAFYSVNEFLNR